MDKDSKEFKAALVLREWAMAQILGDIALFGNIADESLFDLCACLEELFPDLIEELERAQKSQGDMLN